MHKPNPAKFYAPMYFQYLKMFHVYLYLELSRFFLPIAKEFGWKTVSEIFERKSARLLRRDYFTFNLETNYWNSNSDFISCAFYKKTLSTKALITTLSRYVPHRYTSQASPHRHYGIYLTEESRAIMVTQARTNSGLGKKTGYLQTCYQLVNILVYSTKSMGQKSSNQYHQFKNCPVYQQWRA